jgi:5,10-methylenetetrahydromethanopterin reductase
VGPLTELKERVIEAELVTPALGVLLYSDYTTDELVSLGELCEAVGYRWFWYTDVRFARDCYLGLAAVAAKTRKIRLGPGVTDPYSRHPALTASAIATLDEMCGGRAALGLGTGGAGFRELGLKRTLPVAAMREAVEAVRALLRGDTVTLQGKVITLVGGRMSFTPPRPDLPIYFATHGPQVTRLAGQIADGVLIANTLAPAAFAHYLEQLDAGFARAARDPAQFDIGLRVEACISDDNEAAYAVMRRRAAARLLGQYPHWDHLTELGIALPPAFTELAQSRPADAAERAAPLLPREAVETMVLAGDAETIARQLAHALNPRITQLTVRPHAIEGQKIADVIRAFAEQVVPRAIELRERVS